MNKEHIFSATLDEFCKNERYTETQKGHFRENFSETGALVIIDGNEFISLAPYMNCTLAGLESGKREAYRCPSLEIALDYDFVCRAALDEWVPLSAAVLRNFDQYRSFYSGEDEWQGLSELVSDMKRIVNYFLDAQDILLALNPISPSLDSLSDTDVSG